MEINSNWKYTNTFLTKKLKNKLALYKQKNRAFKIPLYEKDVLGLQKRYKTFYFSYIRKYVFDKHVCLDKSENNNVVSMNVCDNGYLINQIII